MVDLQRLNLSARASKRAARAFMSPKTRCCSRKFSLLCTGVRELSSTDADMPIWSSWRARAWSAAPCCRLPAPRTCVSIFSCDAQLVSEWWGGDLAFRVCWLLNLPERSLKCSRRVPKALGSNNLVDYSYYFVRGKWPSEVGRPLDHIEHPVSL